MSTILVVVAHPDDEVLGCGATMARHSQAGDTVHVLLLADGETARGSGAADRIALRRAQAAKACAYLGVQHLRFADFPDNRMDTVPLLDVVGVVEDAVRSLKPTVVYTHHRRDLNVDHRIAHQAVMTACRPLPGHPVRSIYAFEIASSTGWSGEHDTSFIPTRWVDVEAQLNAKKTALACYVDEIRAFPHVRSIEAVEALARWRGASVGLPAAEAFEVIRETVGRV